MKREKRFELVNELSKAVTDQTVYDHTLGKERLEYLANTNTLKINEEQRKKIKEESEQKIEKQETEEEIFARIYAQRKSGK